jgi:hypothetical protein
MPKKSAKAKTDKKVDKKTAVRPVPSSGERQFTPQSYHSKRLRRKAERNSVRTTQIPAGIKLLTGSIKMMAARWEIFGGILLIFAIINLLLIGGFSGVSELQSFKSNISSTFSGQYGKVTTGVGVLAVVVANGTTQALSNGGGPYQAMLLIVVSLALVWAFRQLYAKNTFKIRDAFYQGMYPLVPVLLVLLVIGLQLIPAFVGIFLFNTLVVQGILTGTGWGMAVAAIGILLTTVTLYWLCSSLFALYIVTLPDMTPLAALRSARNVVRYRRAAILRKILFLVLAIVLPVTILMVPISVFATIIAIPVFFALSVVAVGVIHGYLYALYRSLIAE